MNASDLLATDGVLAHDVIRQKWFARVGQRCAPEPFDTHDEAVAWLRANGALGELIYWA